MSFFLGIIYLSFISLGLPDALLGAAWPNMYPEFQVPVSDAAIIWLDCQSYIYSVIAVIFADFACTDGIYA